MRAPDGPWALMMRITTRVHHQQRPLEVSNELVRCDRATVESQGLKDESHGRTVDHIVCDHKVERRAHPVRTSEHRPEASRQCVLFRCCTRLSDENIWDTWSFQMAYATQSRTLSVAATGVTCGPLGTISERRIGGPDGIT